MAGRVIKVASVQLQISDEESKEARVSRVEAILDGFRGFDLVVLPETWNVGYFNFDEYAAASEALDGETLTRIGSKAKQIGGYIVAGSIIERTESGLYNTTVMFDRAGRIVGEYRKIHLFGYGSREPEVLKRGHQVTVVETEFGRVGLSTCYDLRFPELYRKQVDMGAEIFVVVSAWPYPRIEHWKQLNSVRAFENQCFLISSNCVGQNRGIGFIGRSAIVDPFGWFLAAGGDYETILTAEIDVDFVVKARADFPALRDRVPL